MAAAALLAALTVYGVVSHLRNPPPMEYGPFGFVHSLLGAGLLLASLVAVGSWALRRPPERRLTVVLVVLVAAGPVGWLLGLLDSLTCDLINSIDAAGPVVALVLLVVFPLLSVIGFVAAVAEYGARWSRRRDSPFGV